MNQREVRFQDWRSWIVGGFMKPTRLLLPFHHGMNMSALEQAVRLAKGCDATLVLLALIQVREGRRIKAPRLDLVQQARDFFAASRHKAAAHGVPVEVVEVYTHDIPQAIESIAREMQCDGVVLFLAGNEGVLLSATQIVRLIERAACKAYVMRMPVPVTKTFARLLLARFLQMVKRTPGTLEADTTLSAAYVEEEATPVEA
jgi:hypothetical protein